MKRPSLILALVPALLMPTACEPPHDASISAPSPVFDIRAADGRPVEKRPHLVTEDVVGTTIAKKRAVVEARISGHILSLPLRLGQSVTAGQTAATLDAAEIRARLRQAEAVDEQAESELARYTKLLGQDTVTRQEFESVKARAEVARATVAEAKSLLDHATVTIPFDGVVSRKLAETGDLAVPGKPLLEIEDASTLRFEAGLPEALIDRVAIGQQLSIRWNREDRTSPGTVTEISPAADPDSRTFPIQLELESTENLRPGQFGRLQVPLEETESLRVPASAVLTRGQLEQVFVTDGATATLRLVRTGKRFDDSWEILSGLAEGERVILHPPPGLRDGSSIRIVE